MKLFVQVLEKYPEIKFKQNSEMKIVRFEVVGTDANNLRIALIKNKVIMGIEGNNLVVSLGIANRKIDVKMFDSSLQMVLNK